MDSGSESFVVDRSGKRRISDDDAIRSAKRQAVESAIDGDTLCDRCNSIQWAQLTEQTPLLRNGKDIARLKISQETLRLSHCRVCRILSSIKPKSLDTCECKIKAISSRITFGYGKQPTRSDKGLPPRGTDPECTVLCIVPDVEGSWDHIARTGWHQGGCLGLTFTARGNPKQGPRFNLSQSIDYDMVKRWISFCCHRHSKRCSPPPMKRLQGLQVIDCRLRSTIKAATTCRYIALSYVWGQRSQGSSTSEFAPAIEDSISVTLSLGFRYLWVDRYCINQDDPNKDIQIAHMSQIYSQAELTLVAGAGTDDRYGLPGVGKRARKPQEKINIGPVSIVRIPPHTSYTLRSSEWASRGWTYQESILSNRRLVFTDDQVSYLCNDMYCAETVDLPPEQLNKYKERDTPFAGMIPRAATYIKRDKEAWPEYHDVKNHVMEFSKRRLTYDSDALNAILSIFNAIPTKTGAFIMHLCGLPIKLSLSSSTLFVTLQWYHSKAARRRDHFPSWSWTGWDGAVRITDPDVKVPDDCMVQVLDPSENTTSLYQYLYPANMSSSINHFVPTRLLLIKAKIINVILQSMTWNPLHESFSQETQQGRARFLDGIHARLPMTENVSAFVYAYLDQEMFPANDVIGLILGQGQNNAGIRILLLEPHGEFYQRIGLLRYRSGGDCIPHVVYMDAEDNILDEIKGINSSLLWMERAVVKTVRIV